MGGEIGGGEVGGRAGVIPEDDFIFPAFEVLDIGVAMGEVDAIGAAG